MTLIGKKLKPSEGKRSAAMAPRETSGQKRRLCWNFSCHCGCPLTAAECPQSHQQITTTAGLDWTVVAQFIRRRGLRNGKIIAAGDADARIDALRQQDAQAQAAKKADGKARPKASGNQSTPDEYLWFDPIGREQVLSEVRKGPDTDWTENIHTAPHVDDLPTTTDLEPEAQRRLEAMHAIDKDTDLSALAESSQPLNVLVRNLLLDVRLAGGSASLTDVLATVLSKGTKGLKTEAEALL